jgi:predicted DNA-binding transcriptional regulator YafY
MRANRLVGLLLLLQARGRVTAEEVATELGVSRRTVYRDLAALAEGGVPIQTDRGAGGGIQLHPRYQVGLTGLSARDAETLFTVSVPTIARQLGIERSLSAARQKLVGAAASGGRKRYRERIHLDLSSWFRDAQEVPALRPLVDAIWSERAVEIRYRRYGGESRSHVVNPLGLVVKGGTWYLVADRSGETRVFRVSRVEHVSSPGDSFVPPADFDLAAFWARWAAEFESSRPQVAVTVRVRERAVGVLARVAEAWNDEVLATLRRDGRDWVRLEVPFERVEYAQSALLTLGGDVEVVAPRELRRAMAAAARRLARIYAAAHVPEKGAQ